MACPATATAAVSLPHKILLLACGSFNPVTNIHLRMFELARDHLHRTSKYRVQGGVISPTNDKYQKRGLAPGTHRLEMVKRGVASSTWVQASGWEVEQPEWTTTREVIAHMQNMVTTGGTFRGVDSDARVKLLCGGDLLESFAVPNLWSDDDIETIVGRFGIVVITRAGSEPQRFIDGHALLTKHRDNIDIVEEWVPNEISATKLRLALSRGESVKYLTPDPVVDYIHEHKLYQN